MAGSDATYDAIFYQSGIQRVEGMTELFHYVEAFSSQPLPKGNRIAIITNAGGPGIMATDAAIRHGLKLATLSDEDPGSLKESLPPTASLRNPVDVIGDATHERYEAAIRAVLMDDGVDGAIVILTPQAMTDILETAEIVPRVAKDVKKPISELLHGAGGRLRGGQVPPGSRHPQLRVPRGRGPDHGRHGPVCGEHRPPGTSRREVFRLLEDQEKAALIAARAFRPGQAYYMTEKEANELLTVLGLPAPQEPAGQETLSDRRGILEEVGLPAGHEARFPGHPPQVRCRRGDWDQPRCRTRRKRPITEDPRERPPLQEGRQDQWGAGPGDGPRGGRVILGSTRDPRSARSACSAWEGSSWRS